MVNDMDSIMTGIHGNKFVWIQVFKKIVRQFPRPDGIPEEERQWLASVWRK